MSSSSSSSNSSSSSISSPSSSSDSVSRNQDYRNRLRDHSRRTGEKERRGADRDWDRRGRIRGRRETISRSRSRSRSYNRNRSGSRSLSRYRNRSRSSSRNSTRSTEQARPTDQISIHTDLPPTAIQDDGELIIADAIPPPLDQEPLLPKSFRLDKARSKELRSWMTSAQKPTEAKQLRENFHPSFEKRSFEFKVPVLDPSMARRLKEVRGGEASKAEAKEKALVASQFKILDIAKPMLYLWGSASASNDPVLISAAESALQLWGHAFHSITMQRRENVLHQTDPRFEALLSEPGRFKARDCGLLFGRTFLRSMVRDASDDQKLKSLGQPGGRPSTSSSSRHSRPSGSSRGAKSGRTGSGFTLHGNFNKRGTRPGSSFNRGSSCRSPVKGPAGLKRLDAESSRIQSPKSSLEPTGGPICLVMEQADGPIRELGLSSGRVSSRRLQHRLEGYRRIRIPAILSDSEMSDQDMEGAGGADARDPVLAGPALVPVAAGADVRASVDSSEKGAFVGPDGPTAPTGAIDPTNRLAVVRNQMESGGFSDQVVNLLLGGVRNSTSAAYQSAWNGWHSWCVRQGADPMSPPLEKVLEFLSWLVGEGKAYRTVNVARSMLSSTLGKIDGVDIGKHPLVVKLMKGAYNKMPPAPKYAGFWDVNLVINYIISLGPNDGLSLAALSSKLAVLLALSSLCRVSELANIVKDSIVIDDEQAKFSLSAPRKSQRASPLQVITLKKLHPVSLACPVETLKQYISVSEQFRVRAKARLLLLGLRPPRSSVSGSTVARWIKSILAEAGVDTTIYSAHSTRGASASNAANRGVPTDAILSAGCWKSESTFTRFYRGPTAGASVASALHMGR
ncbi:uncharacterized protein LOC116935744 isoform X2 [Daphnia magna]|uniref:uncharacterized protein LOC116935744 isoform X2 n=1 Tax=Daphnia magna TaxID=35525 RepID=UPI001E1BBABA|nr:uncharacterized protein LOC116935744 isoform X2 [Daphnia magna]